MGFLERHHKFFARLGILLVTIPGAAQAWSGLFIKEPLVPYLIEKAGGVDMPGNIILIALPWLLIGIGLLLLFLIRRAGKSNKQKFYLGKSLAQEGEKVINENEQPHIHVESHNQQGGITAYQVNIQPGDRQLTPNVAQQMKDYLGKTDFKTIEVNAIMGDAEAFRFASQVKNYLVSEGFETKGVNQVVYATPVQGQIIEPPNNAGLVKIIIGGR